MKQLNSIETPSIIIDMAKVQENLKKMREHVAACGCLLRPHIKTHKIPELAKLQLQYGACGITCAKVSEAEVMAASGIEDIFIAYPLVGDFRIERAVVLAKSVRLILGVDSLESAKALSQTAQNAGIAVEVRLEVDTGMKRTGVPYEEALERAQKIAVLPGLRLTGIYTFRGLIYNGEPTRDNKAAGYQEGRLLADLAARLRADGMDIRDVSGGSTPTGSYVAEVAGVTEIRPGTYIFQDYMQYVQGTCTLDACAAFVLATVVSTPSREYAVIDGGSKTFATDIQLNRPPFHYTGYGHISDNPDLVLSRVSEEHGIITSRSGDTGLKVGQRLQIIPVHICPTINLHNHVYMMEDQILRKVCVAARGMLI